jgi:hypothetical protein
MYRPLRAARIATTQHELLMSVDKKRRTLAKQWYQQSELLDVALDPNICPTLIPTLDAVGAQAAVKTSRRWLRITAATAKGKHSITHLEQVLDGGKVRDPDVQWTHWYRHSVGEITRGQLQVAAREQARTVVHYLRTRGLQGEWVLAMLPAGPDPYALPIVVEADERGGVAAAEGTRVHAQLEALLRHEYSGQLVEGKVLQAREWLTSRRVVEAEPEVALVGECAGGLYAGTADALATTVNGSRLVVDWKTGRFINPGHIQLQVAALAHAAGINRGVGVHLRDDGWREVTANINDGLGVFNAHLESWWATWAA